VRFYTVPNLNEKCFQNEDLPEDQFLGDDATGQAEGESGFGAPIGQEGETTEPTSRPLQSFQPSLAERVKQASPAKTTAAPQSPGAAQTLTQSAGKKAGQAVAKQAGAAVAKLGGKAAAGLVSGPLGWAATAINATVDAFKFIKSHPKILYAFAAIGLIITLPFFVFFLDIVHLGSLLTSRPGADPNGGKPIKVLADPYLAAIGSGDKGLTAVSSLSKMQAIREKLKLIIKNNPTHLSDSDVAKATTILDQMAALEGKIRTSANGADSSIPADFITQYRQLQRDLYTVLIPNSTDPRNQVIALMTTGAVKTNNYCKGTDSDLKSGPLSPTLLNAVAQMGKVAAANGGSITISCAKSGHGGQTYHARGQAVDIQADPQDPIIQKLLPYLHDNRDQLQIAELIFNESVNGHPAGYYDYKKSANGQIVYDQEMYAQDHTTHIHVGVSQ
jgi:hypothetical protein